MDDENAKTRGPHDADDSLLAAVRAFQAGRREAFDAIYQAAWRPLCLRAARMGLADQDCEEIAQKALVRVYLHAGKARFDSRQQLWAWIYTIAAREVYKHWRTRSPQAISEEGLEMLRDLPAGAEDDPADQAEQGQALQDAGDCIARLADGERLHLLGPLVQNLTFRQAAAVHGLSLGQFKHKYEKALRKVRDCMKGKGHPL